MINIKTALTLQLLSLLFSLQTFAFPEKWVYLMKGEERFFPANAPITDVACFCAKVDGDGHLKGGHLQPPKLKTTQSNLRYHLVVTIPWNADLAHIYLNPKLPFRNQIISDIVQRSKPFDGVQIDFEGIKAADGTAYINFLAAVKKALPQSKIFSVAVMARWASHKKKHPRDAYDYPFISLFADRVIVMAYDEHYSGSNPGSMASLPWCKKIYDYATKTIPAKKLIMGIPLYGRAWQKPSFAHSYKNSQIQKEIQKRGVSVSTNPETGGHYRFKETVMVNVHYETLSSLKAKLTLYSQRKIQGIACWRISQEPKGFWESLSP